MSADARPNVYVLSDSLGETADAVARAALAQFQEALFHVVRLPKITSRGQLQGLVKGAAGERCVFFYTLATPKLRHEMHALVVQHDICGIDILGPAVVCLEQAAAVSPTWTAGELRRTDRSYFERVEALEFAVKHDDGRNVQQLLEAEIVLLGVSRTSKTPLSMYLAFKGYRAANVPLIPGVPPPHELLEIDPRRVFGLVTSADVLVEMRSQRVAELGSYAGRYYDRESIEEELAESRAFYRRLGCIVVSTEGRAIEETAQEVLRYFRASGLEG